MCFEIANSGPLALWEMVRVRADWQTERRIHQTTREALTPGPSPKGRGETFQNTF
jgi:hypothetical protein